MSIWYPQISGNTLQLLLAALMLSARLLLLKLPIKHGWTKQFALKAISEYKKFVYLGVVSNFHVTPSKIIDVVWHEHLLFTRAYREFCDEVIAYQFDHNPELLSVADETGRFNAQYLDTIEFYISEFGFEPPTDIWGETKFDKEKLKESNYSSRQKTFYSFDSVNTYYSDDSLSTYFGGSNAVELGGGDFGGGGASGGWSDGNATDTGSSDSGGDSGGGCSGGCGGD